MGIYYSVTVGVGFEVPLEAIRALPDYEKNGESAHETLDEFLYQDYPGFSYATAHEYDANDEETSFVIAISRLTESYDDNGAFDLVLLDSETPTPTRVEELMIRDIQEALGIDKPVVPFVASSLS